MDVIFIGTIVVFFAATYAFAAGCDKLGSMKQ